MSTETIDEWAARVAPTLDWEAFRRVFEDEGEAPLEAIEAMERAGLLHIEHGEVTAKGGLCWGADGERLQAMNAHRDTMIADAYTDASFAEVDHE